MNRIVPNAETLGHDTEPRRWLKTSYKLLPLKKIKKEPSYKLQVSKLV